MDKVYDFIYRHPGSDKREKIRGSVRSTDYKGTVQISDNGRSRYLSPGGIEKVAEVVSS